MSFNSRIREFIPFFRCSRMKGSCFSGYISLRNKDARLEIASLTEDFLISFLYGKRKGKKLKAFPRPCCHPFLKISIQLKSRKLQLLNFHEF